MGTGWEWFIFRICYCFALIFQIILWFHGFEKFLLVLLPVSVTLSELNTYIKSIKFV